MSTNLFSQKETHHGLQHHVTWRPKLGIHQSKIIENHQKSRHWKILLFPAPVVWARLAENRTVRLWYGPGPHWRREPGDIQVAQ